MRFKLLSVLLFSLLIASGLFSACGGTDKDIVSGTGVIEYIDLEGGFYGIMGDDGERYDPMNLDEEYREDGLKVRFKAKILDDVASFHQWGTIVEITEISIVN